MEGPGYYRFRHQSSELESANVYNAAQHRPWSYSSGPSNPKSGIDWVQRGQINLEMYESMSQAVGTTSHVVAHERLGTRGKWKEKGRFQDGFRKSSTSATPETWG